MAEKSERAFPSDFYGQSPNASQLQEADPADVGTIDSIIHALYECLSGPAGQPRNWKRMCTLFLAEAHSIRTGKLPDGTIGCRVMNTSDYIEQIDEWLVRNGFFERAIHRVVEHYGVIAHVFSTYESPGRRMIRIRSCGESILSSLCMTVAAGGSLTSCGNMSHLKTLYRPNIYRSRKLVYPTPARPSFNTEKLCVLCDFVVK